MMVADAREPREAKVHNDRPHGNIMAMDPRSSDGAV
jgi:hypothetical protein